jgi:hypothetical protein
MNHHWRPYRWPKVRRHLTESWKIITGKCHLHWRPYRRPIVRRYFTESWKIITGKCHIHRWPKVRRNLTESWKIITGKCHNHRQMCRRIYVGRYVVGGSILPTTSPTDSTNSKGRCIKCISDRVIWSTELPTDRENMEGN